MNPPYGQPVRVAAQIRRILAPNPSPMTAEGTQTFLVGERDVAIIDPGPDHIDHIAAIMQAVGQGRVSHILVTHSHIDHSEAVQTLRNLTGAPVIAYGKSDAGRSAQMQALVAAGLPQGMGVDDSFNPDRLIGDDEALTTDEWTITAHHTPGHMANHLSFGVGSDLMTGDFIMRWSSSMIAPPDGDLIQFFAACEKVQALGYQRLLPAHGDMIDDPAGRIAEIVSHRQDRNAQILAALRNGAKTQSELTEIIYADVPAQLKPAAALTLAAHLYALIAQTRIVADPDGPLRADTLIGLSA